MKKFLLAAIAALSFVLPSAHADSARPPVDPTAAAAVRELLVSMKYRELIVNSFAQMEQTIPDMMRNTVVAMIEGDKRLSPAQKKDVLARMERELPSMAASLVQVLRDPALIDEMMSEMVPMYARHFTAAEIGELAAFYKSPLGMKMLTKMPEIMNESMQLGQRVVMPRVGATVEKMMQGK